MAETISAAAPALFNNALETGVRATILLNAAYPRAFDVTEIVWFDHLIVHTGDIGGPPSLHPDVPQRSGELLVRRRLVEDSLFVMRRLHLLEFVPDGDAGLLFRASEEAVGVIELMRTPYSIALRERAEWLACNVLSRSRSDLEHLIAERIGRWRIEFHGGDAASETNLHV
ncbi:ABC-three component system middle component 2 [Xanthobacter aminoxidans]|uniref:ABC-three component system middle component 2 n=1 Tax=Xanthobacter aminoxidans TaxID=186280 RepID=UPI0037284C06